MGCEKVILPNSERSVRVRWAKADDSAFLAQAALDCSHGVTDFLWREMAWPGKTAHDFLTDIFAGADGPISYQNCLIAELDGKAVGMVQGAQLPLPPTDSQPLHPVLEPFEVLQQHDSLHWMAFAVVPEHRACGVGHVLMSAMDARARREGFLRLTLIVFEENYRAVALYRRAGYAVIDRHALVLVPGMKYCNGDILLMEKIIDSKSIINF